MSTDTPLTTVEKNRVIADWIDPKPNFSPVIGPLPDGFKRGQTPEGIVRIWSPSERWVYVSTNDKWIWAREPDFYTSEEASSLAFQRLLSNLNGRSLIFSVWSSGLKKVVLRIAAEDERMLEKADIYVCENTARECIAEAAYQYVASSNFYSNPEGTTKR